MWTGVEWHIMPEPGTAAGALQSGEIDWYEAPPPRFVAAIAGGP